ncbi:MAG: outer membrane lipoprotein-sorting protein [Myxococcota bacterium]|nr:outer membrane lipoprotein-sorting protein [Myxococcota bacterium]
MQRRAGLWTVLALTVAWTTAAWASDGEALMRALDDSMATAGERITVQMTRTTGSGAPREAEFVMTTLAPLGEAARSKIVFTKPAGVAGTAVLTVEEEGKRSQWVYVPEVGMVRKLASPDRTEAFAGTDFTLEDLKLRSDFANRSYRVLRTESYEGAECTVIEDTAANEKEQKYSGYGKVLLWVEQGRWLVWKVEFFDEQGRLQKILTAHDLHQYGDRWRFDTAKMTHLLDGSTTTFAGSQRETDVALTKSDFAPTVLGD